MGAGLRYGAWPYQHFGLIVPLRLLLSWQGFHNELDAEGAGRHHTQRKVHVDARVVY